MKLLSVGSLPDDLVVSHLKGINIPIWVDLHSRGIVDTEENTEVVVGGKNIDIRCCSNLKNCFLYLYFSEKETKTVFGSQYSVPIVVKLR